MVATSTAATQATWSRKQERLLISSWNTWTSNSSPYNNASLIPAASRRSKWGFGKWGEKRWGEFGWGFWTREEYMYEVIVIELM